MRTVLFSHLGGLETVDAGLVRGVEKIISGIDRPLRKKCASSIRGEILNGLRALGWSDPVPIRAKLKLTITATNAHVGLCLQTGNMARFYADLMKLQVAYLEQNIEAAIYILPTHAAAGQMGSNMVNYQRLVKELDAFQGIITLPMVVIGFEA